MFKQGYSSMGLNVLESFYRQYVSLLLIVLVFSTLGMSASQSSSASDSHQLPSRTPLSDIELENPFSGEGISSDTQEMLRAAGQVLRSHDVSLVITLNMPTQKYGKNRIDSAKALRYLFLVAKQFSEQPAGVVQYALSESEGRTELLALHFIVEEGPNV